jgi:hypothetical protein
MIQAMMAGGNEAQRSDRLELPKNTTFTFITNLNIQILRQFYAVTALRFVRVCHNEKMKVRNISVKFAKTSYFCFN